MGIDLALNALPGGGLLKPIKGAIKAGKNDHISPRKKIKDWLDDLPNKTKDQIADDLEKAGFKLREGKTRDGNVLPYFRDKGKVEIRIDADGHKGRDVPHMHINRKIDKNSSSSYDKNLNKVMSNSPAAHIPIKP